MVNQAHLAEGWRLLTCDARKDGSAVWVYCAVIERCLTQPARYTVVAPGQPQAAFAEWRPPLNRMVWGALWNWLLSQTNHLLGLSKCSVWLEVTLMLTLNSTSTVGFFFCLVCFVFSAEVFYKTKFTWTKDQKQDWFQSNNRTQRNRLCKSSLCWTFPIQLGSLCLGKAR